MGQKNIKLIICETGFVDQLTLFKLVGQMPTIVLHRPCEFSNVSCKKDTIFGRAETNFRSFLFCDCLSIFKYQTYMPVAREN